MNRKIFISFFFFASSISVYAQNSQSGNIKNIEVEIVREKQITLAKAARSFEKVPPHTISSNRPSLSYEFKPLKFNVPAYKSLIRPMKLIPEPISKIYGNFIALGFGSYLAPYLEASITNKRNKKWFYGTHLYHRSAILGPVDEKKSGSYLTKVNLFGQVSGKVFHGGVHVNYENKIGYFYGYAQGVEKNRESILQIYHRVGIGGFFSQAKTDSCFTFNVAPNFNYLFNHTGASESELSLRFHGAYNLSKKGTILLSTDYFFNIRDDTQINQSIRHLVTLRPAFRFTPLPKLLITAGVNVIVDSNISRDTYFYIYPNINIRYDIFENFYAHTSIDGNVDNISLHTLSSENFWLDSNIDIMHTNRAYEYTLGLNAKIGKRIVLGAGFSTVNLKSLYSYQNSSTDQAKFNVLYGDVGRINAYAEIRYEKQKKITLNARGDYYRYNPKKGFNLWHRPTYRFSLESNFDIYRKILLNVTFVGYGGMSAYNPNVLKQIILEPALELDFKISYFISQRIATFIKLENILSTNYPVYLNYKVRGIQVMAGITWSF